MVDRLWCVVGGRPRQVQNFALPNDRQFMFAVNYLFALINFQSLVWGGRRKTWTGLCRNFEALSVFEGTE